MLLIGHRGCKYPGYNQNTIRAFEKVTAQGVPAIEFDVQRCADGQLVVVHNLDLEEVSTGSGRVSHTPAAELKQLWAGDPDRGRDRIPFLTEVFDFFAALDPGTRPAIHMELKGADTGQAAGRLFNEYVTAGRLDPGDLLASSFNWAELAALRTVCPTAGIALLDGAIRRSQLVEKTGPEAQAVFPEIFAYGNEEYMLPRFNALADNLALVDQTCQDPDLHRLISQEIEACLGGRYYNDYLLDAAVSMDAVSVNLWYLTLTPAFVEKAHARGLKVLVYTVNDPEELQAMARCGVDGIFTDDYALAADLLIPRRP